jgi:hypothetical protein
VKVKMSRRLSATEGRVEVEVAALRKLYSRQTALERDLDTLRTEVRDALSLVEDDLVGRCRLTLSNPR